MQLETSKEQAASPQPATHMWVHTCIPHVYTHTNMCTHTSTHTHTEQTHMHTHT